MNTLQYYKELCDITTDKNGYGESIMGGSEERCFLCGTSLDLVRHELFRGNNRKASKLFGLWITVCPSCHENAHTSEFATELHRIGQVQFEHVYDIEFLEVFGRNYR